MSTYRITIAYACLVGMPLLGLVAVMRVGRHLVAPASIGGAWNVEADFSTLGATPCTALLSSVKQPFLTVAQSGVNVVATLNDAERTTLSGVLHDRTLTMGDSSGPVNDTAASCARAIYLGATANPQGEPGVIAGTLGIRCLGCGSVPFRAVRQRQNNRDSH
jgi:hypothetical protein